MAPYSSSSVIQVFWNSEITNWLKIDIYTVFWAEIFTVAAELKAYMPSIVGAQG